MSPHHRTETWMNERAPRSQTQSWLTAVWIFAVTGVTAFLGARASIDAAGFYGSLVQPAWAPPASVFGPVWTVLYVLMAIAAFLAMRAGGSRRNAQRVAILYVTQLAANGLWSWLFFAWHNGPAAIVDVLALLVLIALCLRSFLRINRVAGILFAPYLLWVTFATALTIAMYANNTSRL